MTSRQRKSAIDRVDEGLQVLERQILTGALTPVQRQDAAADFVDAVVGITKPQPLDFFDLAAENARLQFGSTH